MSWPSPRSRCGHARDAPRLRQACLPHSPPVHLLSDAGELGLPDPSLPYLAPNLLPSTTPTQSVLAEDLKATDLEVGVAEASTGGLFR